jgi:hypothetical protein
MPYPRPFTLRTLDTLPDIPESEFLLPLCTNRDALSRLLGSLHVTDAELYFQVAQAIEYIGRPEFASCYSCGEPVDSEAECLEYPPYWSGITWYPISPYESFPGIAPLWYVADFTLPGWLEQILNEINQRTGIDEAITELTGLMRGDVITNIFSLVSLNIDPNNLPGFSFQVEGPATVEVHMISIPAGGSVSLSVDQDPFGDIVGLDSWDNFVDALDTYIDPNNTIIELERDVTALPQETDADAIEELEIPAGTHEVFVRFIPTLNDQIDFLGFGGGLRKIVICGDNTSSYQGDAEALPSEFRFTAGCGLEYRLLNADGTVYQDWKTVSGWDVNAASCFVGATGPQGPAGQDGASQTIIVSDGQIGIDNNGDGVPDETIPAGGGLPNEGLPPPPDSTAPDDLCNAAYYIAGQVIDLANRTIDDAASITISEFLLSLLGVGGWDAGLLNQLWDYVVSNLSGLANANLNQHRAALTEALYCNELDRAAAEADLSGIDQPEQGALVGALRAVTGDKFNLWAFVGSTQASGLDCSAFVCGQFTLSIVGDSASGDTALNVPAGLYSVDINGRYATRDNGRTYDGMYFYSGGDPDFQSPQPLMAGGAQVTVDPVSPRNTSNTGYSTTYNHAGGDLQIINADPQVDDNEPGVVSLTFNPV